MAKILNHPLIDHKISILRERDTDSANFRRIVHEVAMLMVPYVTENLPCVKRSVTTPLETNQFPTLACPIVLAPILRAGLGLSEGFHQLLPEASVAHIGMARGEQTLKPTTYYCHLPPSIERAHTIVLDPMLATGGSAISAVQALKDKNAGNLTFVSLLAAPEGISAFEQAHPDVPIISATQDRQLNDIGYIVPGLGDAGDRIFGTY